MGKKIFEKEFERILKEEYYAECMKKSIAKDFFESGKFLSEIFERKEEVSIVFAGDSITHGPFHTNGYRSYSEYFKEIVRRERIDGRVNKIRNTGVSGATTDDIVKNFKSWIEVYDPEVVFLMIGMNDSAFEKVNLERYEENLKYLINRIRKIGAIPILQTSNTIKFDESRDSLNRYMNIIRKLSKTENVFIIDHYNKWVELEKKDKEIRKKLLNDSIHPNEFGHLEFIKYILKSLNYNDYNILNVDWDLKFMHNNNFNSELNEHLDIDSSEILSMNSEIKKTFLEKIIKEEGTWVFLGEEYKVEKNEPINFKNYVEYIEERIRWELSSNIPNGKERYVIDLTKKDFWNKEKFGDLENLLKKYNCKVMILNINLVDLDKNFNRRLNDFFKKVSSLGIVPLLNLIRFHEISKKESGIIGNLLYENKGIIIDSYGLFLNKFSKEYLDNNIISNNMFLTSFGNIELARLILEELNLYDKDSILEKLYN